MEISGVWGRARGSQVPQPTLGSGLGLHYPYRRGIFLSTLPARPIWTAHSPWGAHWIRRYLTEPHTESQLFSLTCFAGSSRFLSSSSLPLLLELDFSHGFPIFSFCISPRQVSCISSAVLGDMLHG